MCKLLMTAKTRLTLYVTSFSNISYYSNVRLISKIELDSCLKFSYEVVHKLNKGYPIFYIWTILGHTRKGYERRFNATYQHLGNILNEVLHPFGTYPWHNNHGFPDANLSVTYIISEKKHFSDHTPAILPNFRLSFSVFGPTHVEPGNVESIS